MHSAVGTDRMCAECESGVIFSLYLFDSARFGWHSVYAVHGTLCKIEVKYFMKIGIHTSVQGHFGYNKSIFKFGQIKTG